jgi:osmotically-inducible protein OsmY
MKTHNKTNHNYTLIILFTIISIITSSNNFSQTNTNNLVGRVEKNIGNYYTELFEVSADQSGIVTVEGEVNSLFDKLRISELISQVDGVREVDNKIEVKTVLVPDDEIKDNIENELRLNNVILEPEKIKVEVNNGVVNLSGTVSYFREKIMAQSISSWQDGVTNLISSVAVMPPAYAKSDQNLKEIINDILRIHFPLEKNVRFDVAAGNVKFYGSVYNLYAKDHIQQEIQQIIGVKQVINEINVEYING